MNEEQFRQRAHELGYGDFQTKDHVPNKDGPLHTHEFSVMLLVVGGQFALAFQIDHAKPNLGTSMPCGPTSARSRGSPFHSLGG